MRGDKRIGAIVSFLLPLLLVGCGTARRGEPFGEVALTSDLARRGEVVYARHCYPCHPGGEAGVGPAINNKPLPGFLIRMQTRHGLGAMPSFSEYVIPDRELEAAVAYLKELRKQEKPR